MFSEKFNIQIPFTSKWILKKCSKIIKCLNLNNLSYPKLRKKIQKNCSFFKIKIPIKNIIVLQEYYKKKNTVIYIKPLFGNDGVLIEKDSHYLKLDFKNKKSFNVFEHYTKERHERFK